MALDRSIEGPDPVGPAPVGRRAGAHEQRPARSSLVATGTLACPRCDVPVAPGCDRLSPVDLLECPFCRHGARVRDFLSLAVPARATRVEIRVVAPARG